MYKCESHPLHNPQSTIRHQSEIPSTNYTTQYQLKMKFTTTTILAAALATISSAAAVPSAVAGASLPASFNLRVTTATRDTVLEPYLGLIYSESYVGRESISYLLAHAV